MDFVGTGRRLQQGDVGNAARSIGIQTAALLAIMVVETGGRGFDTRSRPIVLPEPHRFYAELGAGAKRDKAVALGLAYPIWGEEPYPKTSDARYQKIDAMAAIDLDAALKAVSWGLPQILGSNYQPSGYAGAVLMVEDFKLGEAQQLGAMCRLLKAWGLDAGLRNVDLSRAVNWQPFARRYNGPGYAKNEYDDRLAVAFAKHVSEVTSDRFFPVLVSAVLIVPGAKGEAVHNLQADLVALGFDPGPVDGRYGAKTEAAVRSFQQTHSLTVDGRAGPQTQDAIKAALAVIGDAAHEIIPQDWDREAA